MSTAIQESPQSQIQKNQEEAPSRIESSHVVGVSAHPIALPDRAPASYIVEGLRSDANAAVKDGRLAPDEVEEFIEERLAVWHQQVEEMQEQLPGDDFVMNETEEEN